MTANRIQVWNGSSWSSLGGKSGAPAINTYAYIDIDPTTGNLYLAYSSSLYRYNKVSDNWSSLGSIGWTYDLKYNSLTHCVFAGTSSTRIYFYNIATNSISSTAVFPVTIGTCYALDFDNNGRLYVTGWPNTSSQYSHSIMYYNASLPTDTNGTWVPIYTHRNTSGVLEFVIDANKNIFAFTNFATLVLGTYLGSNTWSWQNYSQGSTVLPISGPGSGGYGGDEGGGEGDPHITTIFGTRYFLITKKYFRLFDNNSCEKRFFINAKCSKGQYPSWRSKEYISTLYFQIGQEYLIVNTGFRGKIPNIDKTKLLENGSSCFSITQNDLAFEPNVMEFCSECKFKSVDRKKTDDHVKNTGHKIIPNIRGQIIIKVTIDSNTTLEFIIENINEKNFEPCKVIASNLHEHNITNYSGAIIRKLADNKADVSCLYDNEFLFDI